jgi:hypothetical protein
VERVHLEASMVEINKSTATDSGQIIGRGPMDAGPLRYRSPDRCQRSRLYSTLTAVAPSVPMQEA